MQTCARAHTHPPWLQGHTHTLPWVLPTLPIPGKAQTCSQAQLGCLVPLDRQPHPRTCHQSPPPPDTHTQQVHTQSHQGQGSGLNAFNGPDTWIGLTPRPHPWRCQCSNQKRRLRRCLREEGAPGVPDGTALGHMQASAHRTMGRRPQKQGPLTLSHCFIH